ncbi:hypothetical protein LCGC14_1780210 [marine sediment metagenome]|uniref:Uncharacterized protein n=1 Tax=marine sediment metagenome TaxID=412755 RepID=A0A0F9GVL7_9ZZZZ
MKIDWFDGESYGVIVPWDRDELAHMNGKTHYYDNDLLRRYRSDAISAAVKRYTWDAGETAWPPTVKLDALFNLHRQSRDRIWAKLYRKGYRVVKLKIRAA